MKRQLSLVDMPNASDDMWIDVDNRKSKRTKNKTKDKTPISASQPAELIDAVINAVAVDSAESVHKCCCSSTQTDSSDFSEAESNVSITKMELMTCELRQLKETVAMLSAKIDGLSKAMISDFQPKTKPTDLTYASALSAPAYSAPSAGNTSSHNARTTHSSHHDQRHDPVTAMYIDLSIRKQRSNNIVITGLPPAESPEHEVKAVTDLLTAEFGWDTDLWPGVSVTRCRRLGKPNEGKFQPLLVTLDTREQAEFYVKNASLLRQSSQAAIRDSVFINPDLTPSEAKAAFELRQRRRRRRQELAAATNEPSAIPSRTFYQSSNANRKHGESVNSPTATQQKTSTTSSMTITAANLSSPAVDLPGQLKSPISRLVYRSAVTARDDDHHSEQFKEQLNQPPPSTSAQQLASNSCPINVTVDVHAPFNDSGRLSNSNK